MSTDFLLEIAAKGHIASHSRFVINLSTLLEYARENGLSSEQLQDIVNVALNVDISAKIFQNLILCLIPKKNVPGDIIEQVLLWILCETYDVNNEQKIVSLLDWIVNLLKFHLVEERSVDQFYHLLFPFIENNWKSLYHLIYLLTKVGDVTVSRINRIYEVMKTYGSQPHQYALLKRFKDLNPNFMYRTIVLRKIPRDVFADKSNFVETMKSNFSKIVSASSTSEAMPVNRQRNEVYDKEDVSCFAPPVPNAGVDGRAQQLDTCYVNEIRNGVDLAKNLKKLTLPQKTLSLLKSTIGVHVLMFSKRSLQEHFLSNLYVSLEESLLTGQNRFSIEDTTNLLNRVVRLQRLFQQGFISVSRILSLYLENWDGFSYRDQIYDLVEWFVFTSSAELNRFLLLPLYTLFITASASEMANILRSLQNLNRNLYCRMVKDVQKVTNIYDEYVLRSRTELKDVVQSLTTFQTELYKIGLYIYPCNNLLLASSIMFYEEIHHLETVHKMPWWTLIPSNVVYNCIFSSNAHLLNYMCNLLLKYREEHFRKNYEGIIQDLAKDISNKDRLARFAEDLFNIFWAAKAYAQRMEGKVFLGLSADDEISWKQFANLNNSLTLEKHIMLAPYRSSFASQLNIPSNKFSKEKLLRALKKYLPTFIEVLERIVLEDRSQDEDDILEENNDSVSE